MKCMLTAVALLLYSFTFSQHLSLDQLKNFKPRNIGPAGMSGRITSIDVVVDHPDTWLLGSASGGVWKTENAGISWQPLFDEQPTLNIGSVAIQQSNPNILWVGTGEGNPRNSLNLGEGIFKSMDGGKTWKCMGLQKTSNIHRILIDPAHPNTVYAGAIGNPYAEHPERGVYKSTDGGETWSHILHTNDTSGCADLAMDPSNPNRLIAAMWQHRRTPWSFKSGGPGSGLYLTVDGGQHWKKLGKGEGLPDGDFGRIGLAFSQSMPSRVYAMVEATKNGLYKSEDGGATWELVNSDPQWVTNRPFYFQDIAVDTKNENRLYSIHDKVDISEDGGKTFRVFIPYYGIHPDHHAWWISPHDPSFMLDGNDGGMGITYDRGKHWTFNDKLPVGQFYHINVDDALPYHVMGGMQDNGTWHGPAYTWTNGGIRNYYWQNIGGGDGFDAMPDPDDAAWVYSMSQMGNLGRHNILTGENWYIKPPATDRTQTFRFNWNSAIAQDPFDHNTIYYGSQFVHKSTNKGASWQLISPDLTTNNPAQQKQDENGGLTLDVTGAENYNTILAIAPSARQAGVIWVSTDDGNVQLTRDGGATWTSFRGKIPGMPVGCWIPQVQASRYNAAEAFVVANDYRRGDFQSYIFRTTDFGKTWTRIVDDKKVKGYALCVLQDPVEPNLIFAGTEHGLWVSFDNGTTFQQWQAGYPPVSTFDLAIQEREADLVIASFGRSIWILDDIWPLRKIAANKGHVLTQKLTLFGVPTAYQANITPQPGYEWSTWGLYDAENRNTGAAVSYFINPAKATTDTAAKKGKDSVQVTIYNDRREEIRHLKWKADTGFNRQYWGLEEKGYRQPGTPRPKANAVESPGLDVFPGTYTLVMTMAGVSDSVPIVVKGDPRLQKSLETERAQRQLLDRLRKSTDKLIEGMDRLTDAEEVLSKYTTELKGLEGKEADTLQKSITVVQDSIKAIHELINGKKVEKQGLSRPSQPTVLNRIGVAQTYIMGKSLPPGQQEEALVANAEATIREVVQRINDFYRTDWSRFRQLAESTKVTLFKNYEPIK